VTSLTALRKEAASCRNCELFRNATQTVFGKGPARARVVLVGEQPGDAEDRAGKPFVGPAGRLLDEALAAAGIERPDVYVTNAVKHFKWRSRGTRRIHQRPNAAEVAACRPWLLAELDTVRPEVLVALGATAAQTLLGRSFRVTKQRGEPLLGTDYAPYVVATIHPAAVLRERDDVARRDARAGLVRDLEVVRRLLDRPASRRAARARALAGAKASQSSSK
jgi:uracil-DNA glycosylase